MATGKTIQRREILSRISLQRGPGVGRSNLQRVLDALWEAADEEHQVQRSVFKPFLLKLRRYLEELAKQGCLDIVYDRSSPGMPLEKLILKERTVSEESASPAKPKRGARTFVQKAQSAARDHASNHTLIPSPRCFVFIDAPNLYNVGKALIGMGRPETVDFLSFLRTKWEEFRQIGAEITGIPREYQTCFLYTTVLREYGKRFTEKCDQISQTGLRLTTRERKDIDLLLATDMFCEILPYIVKQREIHIVLVSGDSDYMYTLQRVRALARQANAKVKISVITWHKGKSRELERIVDRMYLVEEFLTRLDPVGAENWLRKYGKRSRSSTEVLEQIAQRPYPLDAKQPHLTDR